MCCRPFFNNLTTPSPTTWKNKPRTGVSSSNSTRTRPLRNCPGKKRSDEFSKRIRNLSNLRPPWGAMEPTSLKRDISCSLLAPPSRRNVYKLLDDAVLLLFLFGCCLLNWCEGENGRDGRVGDDAAQRIQMRLGWILAAPVVICQPFETRMTMGFFLESVRSRPQTCRCTHGDEQKTNKFREWNVWNSSSCWPLSENPIFYSIFSDGRRVERFNHLMNQRATRVSKRPKNLNKGMTVWRIQMTKRKNRWEFYKHHT